MFVYRCSFTQARMRHVLIWLLAWLLPLQATAAGGFTVMGPAHFHKPSLAPLVLNDFRHWHPSPVPQPQALLGHSHGATTQQRHHHASGDLSVVRAAQDGPMSNPDGDEGPSAAASLASVLAMIPKCLPWEPSLPVSTLAAHAAWALLTGFDEPPDRLPMRG